MIPGNLRRQGKRNSKWEEDNRRYIDEHITIVRKLGSISLAAAGR